MTAATPHPIRIIHIWYRGRDGENEYYYHVHMSDGTEYDDHGWRPEYNDPAIIWEMK